MSLNAALNVFGCGYWLLVIMLLLFENQEIMMTFPC